MYCQGQHLCRFHFCLNCLRRSAVKENNLLIGGGGGGGGGWGGGVQTPCFDS